MAKFVFTYSGGGEMPESPAERDAVMAAWTSWFQGMGAAVLDMGNPFGHATTVSATGTKDGATSGVTGYSIVEAADLSSAAGLASACPILSAPGGAVEVHEALAM